MSELKTQLTEIININTDSFKGYEVAAKNINDTDLQTMFNRLAQQRKLFIEELKQDLRDYGVSVDPTSSYAGFFHRTWLSTKALFSFDKIEAVIDTSITGEEKVVNVYTTALKEEEIPESLKEKLNTQLSLVKGAINQLREIEKVA
jgi:uncharacterized protein (TIGR02284 family)